MKRFNLKIAIGILGIVIVAGSLHAACPVVTYSNFSPNAQTVTSPVTFSWTTTLDGAVPSAGINASVYYRKKGSAKLQSLGFGKSPLTVPAPGGSWEWLVYTTPAECTDAVISDPHTMTIPCGTAPVTLTLPSVGASVNGETDFQWSAVDGSPTYTLFVGRAGDEVLIGSTRQTRMHVELPPGSDSWWIAATFQQCGILISEHRPIITPREWPAARVRASHLIPTATLRVSVTNDDATPLEQAANVTVDGVFVGMTDASGVATVHTTAGHHVIEGYITGLRSGQSEAAASDGVTKAVSLVMHEGIAPRQLQLKVEKANGAFLPASSPTFDLSLRDMNGLLVPAASIESVEFRTSDDQSLISTYTRYFAVTRTGLIRPLDMTSLGSLLRSFGVMRVSVTAIGLRGEVLTGSTVIFLTQYSVSGRLVAPPSAPGLGVSGVPIHVTYLPANLNLDLTSAADGSFSLPQLPPGPLSIDSVIQSGGKYYYGQGTIDLSTNINLKVNMRTLADVIAGVPPIETTVKQSSLPSSDSTDNDGGRANIQRSRALAIDSQILIPKPAASLACDVSTTSAAAGVAVTALKAISVPKDTVEVTVKYQVHSDEYPFFVKAQSIYNDVWEVVLYASDGRSLYSRRVQVNSQLYSEPIWQQDSTTGLISQTVDVSAYTKTGPASLTLYASAMNIGDALFPTNVCGALDVNPPPFRIVSILADNNSIASGQTVVSVPAQGAQNTFPFGYFIEVAPDLKDVNRLKLELISADNSSTITTVYDGPLDGVVAKKVNDNTAHVDAQFQRAFPISTEPPLADRVTYRATLFTTSTQASRDSQAWRAVWRMPSLLQSRRFGARDAGGDDWTSKSAFAWLNAYPSLLTRINDITGEHGRNLGHVGHKYGNDIDLLFFDALVPDTGAGAGDANYAALARLVTESVATTSSKTRVAHWITATRAGLDNLSDAVAVSQLFSGIGSSYSANGVTLTTGWMRQLLESGRAAGVQFVPDAWSNSIVYYNTVHNNHIHVTLAY